MQKRGGKWFVTLNGTLEVVLLGTGSVLVNTLHGIGVDQGEDDDDREQEHTDGKE